MFTSEIGIIIFKHPENKPIFWNENAIKMLSECTQIENHQDLWTFLDKTQKDKKQPHQLKVKDKILEYNVYTTENYKWAFLKDITEQKRLESIAEEMNYIENLSNIFSSIRHEITNPLITTKISLSILKKKLSSAPPEEKMKYIERIEESLNRMEKLISSLKTFSIFNEFELEPTEINDFIRKEEHFINPYIEENDINLILQLSEKPLFINANLAALRQIFLNIIFNAVDATAGKEEKIIKISTEQSRNKVIIKISNNGEKIPEKNLNRIFEPFFTTKEKGTGLGMAIVKKFVTMMKGTIDVESNSQETSFILTFERQTKEPL